MYVYQLYHYYHSSSLKLTAISFEAFTPAVPVNVSGVGTSFYITPAGGTPLIGTTAGSWGKHTPTAIVWTSDWTSDPPRSEISVSYILDPIFRFDPTSGDGVSYLFGFVHSLPPTMVKSNPVDGRTDLLWPLVYTPSPEPSAFILLSAGLLGLMAIRRRYLS